MRHPEQKTIPVQPKFLQKFIQSVSASSISVDESFSVQATFLQTVRNWLSENDQVFIKGLDYFPFAYITNGITHSIETLASESRPLVVHRDEYPFYALLRNDSIIVDSFECGAHSGKLAIISNPFSKTGNIDDSLFNAVKASGAKVWLDCAYLGSIASGEIILDDSVETVCFSFSKGFGIQYNRIGVMFSKKPNEVFEKYKEFAYVNCAAANLATLIMNEYSLSCIPSTVRPHQLEICKELKINPSDCVWLGLSDCGEKVSLYQRLLNKSDKFIR